MALSVCACGGAKPAETTVSEEDRVKNILVDTDWMSLQSESDKLSFKEDGTGIYDTHDCTWELKDSNIVEITYDKEVFGYYGSVSHEKAVIPFEFTDDNAPKIIRTDKWQNLQTYIPEGNYKTTRGELLDSLVEQAEEFSRDKVKSSFETNEAKAQNYYDNKPQKMTSTVRSIEKNHIVVSETTFQGLPVNKIGIYGIDNDTMIELNKGDKITFFGYLSYYSNISNDISLYGMIAEINGKKNY